MRPGPLVRILSAAGVSFVVASAPLAAAAPPSADPATTIRSYSSASRGDRQTLLEGLAENRAGSLAALRRGAADGSVEERVFSVRALGQMRDAGSLGALLGATADPNASVRKHAVAALRRLGDRAAAPRLRELLVPTQERGLLKTALASLGEMGESADQRLVRSFLRSGDASVRVTAAAALAMLGSEEGLAEVLASTNADDPLVQKNATFALGYFEASEAQARLVEIRDDPSASWRSHAAMALAQHELSSASEARRAQRLGELARGSDKQVASWALDRLAASGAPTSASELAGLEEAGGRTGKQAARYRALLGVR